MSDNIAKQLSALKRELPPKPDGFCSRSTTRTIEKVATYIGTFTHNQAIDIAIDLISAPNTLVITREELEGMIRKPADYTPTSKKEIQLVRHGRNALIDELIERIGK